MVVFFLFHRKFMNIKSAINIADDYRFCKNLCSPRGNWLEPRNGRITGLAAVKPRFAGADFSLLITSPLRHSLLLENKSCTGSFLLNYHFSRYLLFVLAASLFLLFAFLALPLSSLLLAQVLPLLAPELFLFVPLKARVPFL